MTAAFFALACGACCALQLASAAQVSVGGPTSNVQPSLAVKRVIATSGDFPERHQGGNERDRPIALVYNFAGSFAPGGTLALRGQLVSVNSDQAMFSLIGTIYGGDGRTTFGLPSLGSAALVGDGKGVGLSDRRLGYVAGENRAVVRRDGAGQPVTVDNRQKTLPMTRIIRTSGPYPQMSGGGAKPQAAFIGQVASFAGNFPPAGWARCDGQLLSIASNSALFSILGTAYGGDGRTTFALPDLRGRVSVGAGDGFELGSLFGEESTTVPEGQLLGADGTVSISNFQPALALHHLVAIEGAFPSFSSPLSGSEPHLGQIVEFAGNFAPAGWAFAHGATLAINQHSALFSLLGTTYGGNGRNTFQLPDLTGRTLWGTDQLAPLGGLRGSETLTFPAADVPFAATATPTTATATPTTATGTTTTAGTSVGSSGTDLGHDGQGGQ